MRMPALLKCKYVGTYIQHPHKSNKIWLAHSLVAFVEIVLMPFALAFISHVLVLWQSK
jgi:hypothetical protein